MGQFDGLVGRMFFASIFIVSIFSFLMVLQANNSAVDPIAEDPIFNESFRGLSQNIENSTRDSNEKYGVFNSEEPKEGFGSIVLFGIVSVGKTFTSIVFGTLGVIVKLPLIVFGIPATIYNLLIAWLIVVVIVAVWLLYKLGG